MRGARLSSSWVVLDSRSYLSLSHSSWYSLALKSYCLWQNSEAYFLLTVWYQEKKTTPMCSKCEDLLEVLSLILPELGTNMQHFKAVIPSFLLVYTGIISGLRGS